MTVMHKGSFGVDWVTGTSKSDKVGWRWYETMKREKDILVEQGYEVHGYQKHGYSGWQCGSRVWAHNNTWGYFVQVGGGDAYDLYPKLALPLSRFTRLDLQVTVECDPPEPDYIRNVYHAHRQSELPRFTYVSSKKGDTCYLGSRVSERYGRIYDKGLQAGMSEDAGRFIRYEVEVKGQVAHKFEETMGLASAIKASSLDARTKISAFVHDYFSQRSVDMLYNSDPGVPVEVGRNLSTAETKLIWIRSSVRQSFEFLISAGYTDRLVTALGLSPNQAHDLVQSLTQYGQLSLPGLEDED